ncbi:MAG TPA: helix-turn-helix transcriptional regulator [Rhizomicrobium sp.]|nr:helix-turn-helix transcriptional regulator [Rhizomicrobium sp.]
MKSWKFTTGLHTGSDSEQAWSQALEHICLPATSVRDRLGFFGEVSSIISPLGIEFSRVSSSAQTISGVCSSRPASLWLALPVEGEFLLEGDSGTVDLRRGDILYGPTGRDSTLRLSDQFVMLYLRIPQSMLYPRLLNLRVLKMGTLSSKIAGNRVFSNLLRSIVDDLDELTDGYIHPIEVALSEFVISNLAENCAIGCFDLAGASNFQRITQAIEMQLGDGDLTLHKIADQQHVSVRYIQKLFQQAGMSFSQYLRRRRLERCNSDLASLAHRNLSISDICFRWGFNDAAHFSRSFRADYGMTPRAYRQERLGELLPQEGRA